MVFNIGQWFNFFSWCLMFWGLFYIYIHTHSLGTGVHTKSKELSCVVANTENPTQTAVIAPGEVLAPAKIHL